jgi:hypothetical protein
MLFTSLSSHLQVIMFTQRKHGLFLQAAIIAILMTSSVEGGMPAPLPTNWTANQQPNWVHATPSSPNGSHSSLDARLQGISFFVMILLLSALGVQWLWNHLRNDLTWMPQLSYRRSLGMVVLWGLLFVIVLTMISGARELMTPGAWRKQGWTYKLADLQADKPVNQSADRKQALERLRLELWKYAATHQGQFPTSEDPAIDPALWDVPHQPGLKFILVPNRKADETGQVLVCEPEFDGEERQVLMTNGMLGTMRSADIKQVLSK